MTLRAYHHCVEIGLIESRSATARGGVAQIFSRKLCVTDSRIRHNFIAFMSFIKKVGWVFLILFAIIGILFSGVFVAMRLGLTNVRGTIEERNEYFETDISKIKNTDNLSTDASWANSAEWGVLRHVFSRDQEIIKAAARDARISPRILLGGVIGEQLRFFSNRRENFKSYFEPLKILATLSSFSYGIAGLKPETVARIDENLKNKDSVFYLGPEMENVITYPEGRDKATVRFERITDTKNTYYSYLYVGLFMKQVTAQWARAGYDISGSPGVITTLYNLGFNRSIPKPNAGIGGAPVNVNGKVYSFGELGEQFYYSNELTAEFPRDSF